MRFLNFSWILATWACHDHLLAVLIFEFGRESSRYSWNSENSLFDTEFSTWEFFISYFLQQVLQEVLTFSVFLHLTIAKISANLQPNSRLLYVHGVNPGPMWNFYFNSRINQSLKIPCHIPFKRGWLRFP